MHAPKQGGIEKHWGPDEHLPTDYRHPEERGGTGSGMSSGEFWSVRLAERANAWSVALAGATQASRGLY